jgi:F0F1-type ATP synthase membrane subunit c/vacuolar-type H+-ATPase subunit K
MHSLEDTVRVTRLIHVALTGSIPLYALLGELVGAAPRDVEMIFYVLLGLAASDAVALLVLRARFVQPAAEALRTRPSDATELNRWMTGQVISFVLCETVGIFGLLVRVLGGTWQQAAVFYAVSFFGMLALIPRNPANQ